MQITNHTINLSNSIYAKKKNYTVNLSNFIYAKHNIYYESVVEVQIFGP